MNLKSIECTGSCCPSQWEAYTEENEAVYIRYRWGRLTIHMSKPGGTIRDAINTGKPIYAEHLGEELDSSISLEEVLDIIEKEGL